MAIIKENGSQSDFISYLKNKAKLGYSSPPVNTNRSDFDLGSAYRYVTLVPHNRTKEPIVHPESSDCCGPDLNPSSVVGVDADYNIKLTDQLIIAHISGITITLPDAEQVSSGQGFHIKNVSGGSITVNSYFDGTNYDSIYEASSVTTLTLADGNSYYIVKSDENSSNHDWVVI